ncbi:MAG: 2TM domain-containing protein [Candidatus Thermoplasmatota archaeon]|nr:2TM domain-containing protein [Candidatus Thermoplasmatota archaeon]
MKEGERYERARRRVRALRAFYGHFITYAVIMVVLFVIDYSQGGDWWFYWAVLGWGIAVALHGAAVVMSGWEERKVKEFVRKEKE